MEGAVPRNDGRGDDPVEDAEDVVVVSRTAKNPTAIGGAAALLDDDDLDDDDLNDEEAFEAELMIDDDDVDEFEGEADEDDDDDEDDRRGQVNRELERDHIVITGAATLEEADKADDEDDGGGDENEDVPEVALEKLPRPVNELNCRQSRTYLVKLLRAANGGLNPHYGNAEMRPPFWPDYYWPWTQLTDVHTKPRGMNEPLQYSEMMKLAISRGYQYFGYDPDTFVDRELDVSVPAVSGAEGQQQPQQPSVDPLGDQTGEGLHAQPYGNLQPEAGARGLPPKLPKPLSGMNCIQSRTVLAKMLRFQQRGSNPMYGSPETEPPWWPNELIRWVDMVDLRNKPAYVPAGYTYTLVLKAAIKRCLDHFGLDSETYYDLELLHLPGMTRRPAQHAAVNQHLLPPPLKVQEGLAETDSSISKSVSIFDGSAAASAVPQYKVISQTAAGELLQSQPIIVRANGSGLPILVGRREPVMVAPLVQRHHPSTVINLDDDDDEDEDENNENARKDGDVSDDGDRDGDDDFEDDQGDDDEALPPKLPLPIGKMNCAATRTALSKLIRFHCGNKPPNYGNPASMPCWWPSNIIDWTQIKNLSHKYSGFLGNTYGNCLRIAVIRGYAHYGLDANEYHAKPSGQQRPLQLHGYAPGVNDDEIAENDDIDSGDEDSRKSEQIVVEPTIVFADDSLDGSRSSITTSVTSQNNISSFKFPKKDHHPSLSHQGLQMIPHVEITPIGLLDSLPRRPLPALKPMLPAAVILPSEPLPVCIALAKSQPSYGHARLNGFSRGLADISTAGISSNGGPRNTLHSQQMKLTSVVKNCKVMMEKVNQVGSPSSSCFKNLQVSSEMTASMENFFYEDMKNGHKFTDFFIQADQPSNQKKSRVHQGERHQSLQPKVHKVHRLILAAHSAKAKRLIGDHNQQQEGVDGIVLTGVDDKTIDLLLEAIYRGKVQVGGNEMLIKFNAALKVLQSFGILEGLRLQEVLSVSSAGREVQAEANSSSTVVAQLPSDALDITPVAAVDSKDRQPSSSPTPQSNTETAAKLAKISKRSSGRSVDKEEPTETGGNDEQQAAVLSTITETATNSERPAEADSPKIEGQSSQTISGKRKRPAPEQPKMEQRAEQVSPSKRARRLPPPAAEGEADSTVEEVAVKKPKTEGSKPASGRRQQNQMRMSADEVPAPVPETSIDSGPTTRQKVKANTPVKVKTEDAEKSTPRSNDVGRKATRTKSAGTGGQKSVSSMSPDTSQASVSSAGEIAPLTSMSSTNAVITTATAASATPSHCVAANHPNLRKRGPAVPQSTQPTTEAISSGTSTLTTSKKKRKEANKPNFKATNEQILNEKLQEGQMSFVKWLIKNGFLCKEAPDCAKCEVKTELVKYKEDEEKSSSISESSSGSVGSKVQDIDGVAWSCPHCGSFFSVRPNSIFQRGDKESLCWIMRLVLCWSDNTSLMACQQATGADVDKIFLWYDICREYFVT